MKEYAIIFDMDGVLTNSEPVIEAAAIKGLAEYGVQAKPEDFIPFIGTGEDRYIGGVAEKYGVPYQLEMKKRVYEIYLEILPQKLETYEGVAEMITKLFREGYTLAVASSADRIKIDANLKTAGIDPGCFSAIISGEDIQHKKPDPEIFLKAAGSIGKEPKNCIVVEDALNGIKAARAAGMKCIAVATTFSRDQLQKEAPDFILDMTKEVYGIVACTPFEHGV